MVNEEAMHIEVENNINREKENNADSQNIPVEFTEKFVINKGNGTPLKDIPNVVSQLEKKVLSFSTALHCILYGQHDEVEDYKKEVLEFSGFVPHGDEESQREKVKERLHKCTREMLAQLCSVFDVSIGNAFYGIKKKEIIEQLLDFLEAPYDATEEAESFHKEMPSRKIKLETTETLSSEIDTSTSLKMIHEEDEEEVKDADNNATSNEPEEMRGLEIGKSSTVSENPKDGGLNLSNDVLDMNKGSRGVASFHLNAKSSHDELEDISMVNEEAIHIEVENNLNREKENNADSENTPMGFTEKFVINKGKGTPLKDIPNVVSQLEKKVLSFSTTLHCILYGEHDEVEDYKKDVLEFSGFVSRGDEESRREKVKERLHKCTREMLARLCSVFDISVANAFYGMKKKEIIELLLDFLEAPYDATEEAESFHKEMPSRKRKLETTEKLSSEMDTSTSLEMIHEEHEEKEAGNNATSNELEEMRGLDREKSSTVSENPKDGGINLSKDVLDVNEGSRGVASFDLNAKSSSENLTKSVWELEKSNKKQQFTERRVAHGGDRPSKEWCDPNCEEVQKAISNILEKIDITTATFSDVLEELDEHFQMDMSPRKDVIKVMIEEDLYRLADDILKQEGREENQEEKEEQKQDGNEKKNCMDAPCEVPVQI